MSVIRLRELIFALCLLVVLAFINGCAGTASPVVDANTASGSILDARESLALAHSEEALEVAPQEFAQAQNLLAVAQQALEKGKSQAAANLAFQADIEAKIATAIARESKAKRRAAEIQESKPRILWETRTDELAAARTWQTIAERKALEAQEEARKAKERADRQIQKSKAELAIAKAELEMDSAEQLKAPVYAEEVYSEARSSIQAANSALAAGGFQEATIAAEAALKHASNASVQARAKSEAELEESLRGRDKAVAAATKADLTMAEAKESLVGQYAEDMYGKAENLLEEARLAMEARDYGRAESLAEQAHVSASNALAVAEAEERETMVREAQEDAQANALDAVAKAERSLAQAKESGAEEHAGDTYRKANAALQRASQAVLDEDFESAVSLAQESLSHSVTAFTMTEAKTERLRKIEAIENKIMEESEKIADTTVRKTNRGVVISMGGNLFAEGSSQVRNEAKARLKTVADILKNYPDYKVVIEGHTDSIGSDEANLKISRERADNFLMHMVDQEGIPLERVSSVGYGESRPVASNINEEGRRQNRRVDIVILTAPVSP
jgi:outer membrane protein OmpA-like peptidoglycan-associated protein